MTCQSDRCGNHAACARKKTEETARAVTLAVVQRAEEKRLREAVAAAHYVAFLAEVRPLSREALIDFKHDYPDGFTALVAALQGGLVEATAAKEIAAAVGSGGGSLARRLTRIGDRT